MTPLRGNNLDVNQQIFNHHASSVRVLVERVLGNIETVWRITQEKENRVPALGGIDFASKVPIVCAVLHNRFTNYIKG